MNLLDDNEILDQMQPTENYLFRPATREDLLEMIEINRELNCAAWADEKFEEVFTYEVPICVIYNRANEIMGYVVYLYCLEEVKILNLTVAKRFQRNGFARELTVWVLERAKLQNISYALLEVRVDNFIALDLYTKLGFRTLCVREDYYPNEMIKDAYLMQLKL